MLWANFLAIFVVGFLLHIVVVAVFVIVAVDGLPMHKAAAAGAAATASAAVRTTSTISLRQLSGKSVSQPARLKVRQPLMTSPNKPFR